MMDYNSGIHTPYSPQERSYLQITSDELPDRPKMREVAEWLGWSYARVRQLTIKGAIPCKKIKSGKYNVYLFDKAALLEWARPEGVAQ